MPGRKDGQAHRLSDEKQRLVLRNYRRCRMLVKRAKKIALQVELHHRATLTKKPVLHGDKLSLARQVAAQLAVPMRSLLRAWEYVSVVERYPRLEPPSCGMNKAIMVGRLLDREPEEGRDQQLTTLLQLQQRSLAARYKQGLARQARHKPLPKKPGRKLQRISGAVWHERLVEIRQHLQQLGTRGLVELLAETWKPEVQQGYMRELQQLIEELTMLHHRIDSVSQLPVEAPEGTPGKVIELARHRRGG